MYVMLMRGPVGRSSTGIVTPGIFRTKTTSGCARGAKVIIIYGTTKYNKYP